jgi:hypothetical protein
MGGPTLRDWGLKTPSGLTRLWRDTIAGLQSKLFRGQNDPTWSDASAEARLHWGGGLKR